MMPFLDEALLAFVYGSAILATLRAGSRLLYMASHEGSIGQMDGPVIRGPADLNVRMLSSTSSSDESTLPTNKSVHSQSCDWTISPLWEVAYSLERAVAFDGKNENEFTDVMEVTPCERPSYNLKHSRNNWRDNGVYKMSLVGYNPSHSSTNRSDHSTGVSVSIGNTHDDGFVPDEETSSCQGEPAECSWIYPRITSKNCSDISSEDEINSISRNLLVLPLKASKNVLITVQNKIRNLVDVWVAHPIYRGWVNSLSNTFAFMGFWVRGCRAWASLVSPMVSPWREMQCARAKDYSMKKLSPASRSDDKRQYPKSRAAYTDTNARLVSLPLAVATVADSQGKSAFTQPRRQARVTVFAPDTFRRLRSKFKIDEADFVRSLGGGRFVSFRSNSKGSARSGGYFFFSRDGAYMIKSIKKSEAATFLRMLGKYHRYMKTQSRRSLLTRICGLYEVALCDVRETRLDGETGRSQGNDVVLEEIKCGIGEKHILMVMNSVFPAEASNFVSERFDLKGSIAGRECSKEERNEKGSRAILKDLDLAKEVFQMESSGMSAAHIGIHIGPISKAALLAQLRSDVTFLVSCGVMDYSLLVGIVNIETITARFRIKGRLQSKKKALGDMREESFIRRILGFAAVPTKSIGAPPLFFFRKLVEAVDSTASSVLTAPLPYYGAGICGVDGGKLSILRGRRLGKRALYYLGVIDFLQPWTARKVLERELKGLVGYDKTAVSCSAPAEYGERFLRFINAHTT